MFNNIFKANNKKSGQTIVELMVSIGLVAMVVTALLVLVSAATKIGVSSLKRAQASKIAVLALESVRYYRDKESYYAIDPGEVCYSIPNETNPGAQPLDKLAACNPDGVSFVPVPFENNEFLRQIKIYPEDIATNSRNVVVTVKWLESTGKSDGTIFNNNFRQVVLSTSIARW